MTDDTAKRLEKLALHPDFDRARFVLELLGRMGGNEAARVLTKVLVVDDRSPLRRGRRERPRRQGGRRPRAREGAARDDEPRSRVGPPQRAPPDGEEDLAARCASRSSRRRWNASARASATTRRTSTSRATPIPTRVAEALRALAATPPQEGREQVARRPLQILCKSDRATDEDRYALASLELARSNRDTRPASRAGDESLRLLGALLRHGFDVAQGASKKDRVLELDHLYYVGFHFTEEGTPLGEELLEEVVKKGGRAKVAKMAKNKLALVEA